MPRNARVAVANTVYHVINRANGRLTIFHDDGQYAHFEALLEEAVKTTGMRVLAYCLMPNHWHLVLQPTTDTMMAQFMGWLTSTHTRQYRTITMTVGYGHLYQDRYKSFPVEDDKHLVDLIRYVEQNPLRAGLVNRAEDWRWGSLYRREHGSVEEKKLLTSLPTNLPVNYLQSVNELLWGSELEEIRNSVNKSKPYGREWWVNTMVEKFKLTYTLRGSGRPGN